MKRKASTARSDLEQLLVDETATPKALQLSLLEDITCDFSDDQEIGSGGFAVVYKGILGDRMVAVKKLSDAFMDETKFHREIECLMRVKHKNVVRFLGYCADRQGNMERYDGKLVMADVHQRLLCFEYIPKGSLDKYITDPHREWGMCYTIIKGICEGLQSLHDNRIVHLDLKPANILLDDNMTPKITDFGLSRCFNENQSRDITKSILGTIGYLAPELRDGGVIARSADLYSLGVIIIEILTGQKGYQPTEDVLESWRGRLERSQQETLCEQIRVCYETAVECRDFNPMKRPASAQNIIDRLHQMESIQPIVSFAETSGSLLQFSDDKEKDYEDGVAVDEALTQAAASVRSSGSLSQAHFESGSHHPRGAKSAAQHSAELSSPTSDADDDDVEDDTGMPSVPHQPTVSFTETSGSLLQSSDDEEDYEDDEALPHASGFSGSLLPAHLESGHHVKSRGCYRCGKGGGFWGRGDKEACLACGARYCAACVLRAMGSMPEGRKCLACIGRPVAESRRSALGRGSRVLRRLLSAAEVELVMRSERECAANQLRPEDVYVNGAKLAPEELALLQGCPCPPSRLRPGFYWYDKISGLWGKEGHRPHCIISPNLNVGGNLDEKASNGNTGILINGREITKSELQILKLAGVQCAGKPHFWLNADGTYQEEGQKTVKGKIWDKPLVKLLSPVLSLPTPNKVATQCGEESVNSGNRPEYLEQRTIQKLLLVGSGTSTILKQAKFSYKSKPFSTDECEDLKLIIQSNIYRYLGILLEGRERFEEEVLADRRKIYQDDPSSSGHSESGFCDEATEYSIVPRLKAFSDWILKAMALGNLEDIFPAASREYAPLVDELWKDPAIQATYRRRSELPFLPSAASYFLDRVVDISRTEYELCDMDILYTDGITSSDGLASTDISFPQLAMDLRVVDEPDPQDTMLRYQLIRISNKGLRENSKWLEMFDDVRLVVFCVAVSDYDEYYEDANGTIVNKMIETRQLFESIALHPTFEHMDFLLLLTKFDLLEQKIGKSPLTACDWFKEFTPLVSLNLIDGSSRSARSSNTGGSLAQMAAHYIGTKFKRLFHSLTERKLYVSYVNALDRESVRAAIRYGRVIVKWEEEKPSSEPRYSSGEEPSSYSH